MTLKDWFIGGVVIAVAVGGVVLLTPDKKVPDPVVQENEGTLGSASSPSVVDGCTDINGVVTCYRKQVARTATSTICALRAPTTASSTLVTGTANFRVSSTSASIVHLAKATSPSATTTSLGFYALGAGAQGTLVASSTTNNVAGGGGDALDQNHVFAPGQYFVVGFQGAVGAAAGQDLGQAPIATCGATFQVI